jgi:monoamine oxidase
VIIAIPPVQQQRIDFAPPLSPLRTHALQRHPMGHAMKTFMYYDDPFWLRAGYNGSFVGDHGIVTVAIDDSTPPDGQAPALDGRETYALMGFIFGFEASHWATKTPDERKDAICRHYRDVFGTDAALRPTRYKEKNWASEPWVGGCYVGTAGPGVLTTCKGVLREPLGNGRRVQIAGTEVAWVHAGYMDGAVEAGERAARNAAVVLGKLDDSQYDVMSTPAPSPQMPFVDMPLSVVETHVLPSVTTLVRLATAAAATGVAWAVWTKMK